MFGFSLTGVTADIECYKCKTSYGKNDNDNCNKVDSTTPTTLCKYNCAVSMNFTLISHNAGRWGYPCFQTSRYNLQVVKGEGCIKSYTTV